MFESREYGRNNEVVLWRGSTINKQASLYPKIIHARPYEVGLSFVKRETKTLLWAFALHDLVEQKIVIKYIKMFLSIFIAGLHTAIVCPIYLQSKNIW